MRLLSRVFWLLLIIFAIWLIADPAGERLAGLSDSTWWSVLPWVLIVIFWIVIGRQWLKRRRQS